MSDNLPRVLSPFRYREQPGRWRFVLIEDLVICFPGKDWGQWRFLDEAGIPRVEVNGKYWRILEQYAWDGASPKSFFFGRHWGTPDFECTRAATAWHDASGQFLHLQPLKRTLARGEWHRLFRDIIVSQGGRRVGPTYHLGLQLGNGMYQLFGAVLGNTKTGRFEPL